MGHGQRRGGVVAELRRVQLQPDEEHVQHDAELRDRLEGRDDLPLRVGVRAGDQRVHRGRRDRPEQRRPEQDAGDDLADDRRLAEVGERPAEDVAESDDRGERGEDVGDDIDLNIEFLQVVQQLVERAGGGR